MDKLEFQYPWMIFLLLVFIIANYIFKSNKNSFYVPHVLLMPIHIKRNWLLPFLKWIGITMLIISLTSPILSKRKEPLHLSHTIMMILDVSNSMNGGNLYNLKNKPEKNTQLSATKFEVAKEIASQFAKKQDKSNIGVIVFGDFAYVATPLTYDKKAVSTVLKNLEPGIAGSKTAMYDALFLGSSLLKKNSAREKVTILLTDGFNTAGRVPLSAVLRVLESENIKVYTIGMGKKGDYDASVLEKIARKSNGKFFQATSATTLTKVYNQIDTLERSLQRSTAKPDINYLYIYPLLMAFFILLTYMYFILKENE